MKYLLLTITFITSSLFANVGSFEDLQVRWSSVFDKRMDQKFLTADPITEPKGARVVIGELDLLTKDFRSITDCLVYVVPSKSKPGKLLVIQKNSKLDCDDRKFAKPHFEFEEIYNLKIEEKQQSMRVFIDRFQVNFNFFNIINSQISNDKVEFQTKIPGVFISFLDAPAAKSPLSEFSVCSDVPDDTCQEATNNLCHLCPSGNTYKVVASNCKKSLRTYCGYKECGLPNTPACIRGRAATGYSGPFCITDSPMAFCKKPSRVVCLNNELFCR